MKLRNLLFGTMIACAFVACSNDDDPNPTPTEAPDAYLNYTISTRGLTSKASTKAAGETISGEASIKDLTMIIFDENGARIGYQRAGTTGFTYKEADQTYTFNAPTKTKAVKSKVYIVANIAASKIATLANIEDFKEVTVALADQNATSGFTMSSGETEVLAAAFTGHDTSDNPLVLTNVINISRVAARVQVDKIAVSYTGDVEKLDVTGIFVSNVRSDAAAFGQNINTSYDNSTNFVRGGYSDKEDGKLLITPNPVRDETYNKNVTISLGGDSKEHAFNVTSQENNAFFYVMPNDRKNVNKDGNGDNAYTLLCIKGDYTSPDGAVLKDRYYTVKIAADKIVDADGGTSDGNGHVLNNTVYALDITLAGSGSTDPYDPETAAYVNATVKVTPWNQVNQKPSVD